MTTPGGMTRPPKKNIYIDKMFRGFVRAVQEPSQTGDAFHADCHLVDKVGELSKPRMIPVCDKRRDSPYGRHALYLSGQHAAREAHLKDRISRPFACCARQAKSQPHNYSKVFAMQ